MKTCPLRPGKYPRANISSQRCRSAGASAREEVVAAAGAEATRVVRDGVLVAHPASATVAQKQETSRRRMPGDYGTLPFDSGFVLVSRSG
jgi:hypothetical protein